MGRTTALEASLWTRRTGSTEEPHPNTARLKTKNCRMPFCFVFVYAPFNDLKINTKQISIRRPFSQTLQVSDLNESCCFLFFLEIVILLFIGLQ